MESFSWSHLVLLLLLPLLSPAQPYCPSTDPDHISRAFASVSGFDISHVAPATAGLDSCSGANQSPVTEIRLPSRNLTGTVSWMFLRNVTNLRIIDLSGNLLQGSIPSGFWSNPNLVEVNFASNRLGGTIRLPPGNEPLALRALNLSSNRFTNSVQFEGPSSLRMLDLSRNGLRTLPKGLGKLAVLEHLDLSRCRISGEAKPLSGLRSLKYLDVSHNFMKGSFSKDFPPLSGLEFLNISFNNFTGVVAPEQYQKFGKSAFTHAGSLVSSKNASGKPRSSTKHENAGEEDTKKKGKSISWAAVLGLALSVTLTILAAVLFAVYMYRRRWAAEKEEKKQWTAMMPATWRAERSSGPLPFEADAGPWAAGIRDSASAPVVMFEKPLMDLTLADLMAATAGFGRESQLAEGRRSGPVYRGVLPGQIHVAVKVLEKARDVEEEKSRAAFLELARLKHPNLLPLLGYCIAGQEKLLVYEYMENGDLHRWLHELPLPAGRPDVEDWSNDTWEHQAGPSANGVYHEKSWATRHRIALGIARGLAFLHHAGSRPIVHGHLVPSNILLDDELEPRIADFGTDGGDGAGGTAGDVYCYGVLLMEMLTGRLGSEDTVAWVRGSVRSGQGVKALDSRLGLGGESEGEMVECLRVGCMCTAESPEKRPTMLQVVGMLKDLHPVPVGHSGMVTARIN